MELREFHSHRLPGLPRPFSFKAASGLNILTGPNASGKSSVARTLAWLLWPTRFPGGQVRDVSAVFDREGETWEVQGRAGVVSWLREGEAASAPELPPDHLASCYLLDILDLVRATPADDDLAFARTLVRELSGGLDPRSLREQLFQPADLKLRTRKKTLENARSAVGNARRSQESLDGERGRLDSLRRQQAAAKGAGHRAAALAAVRTVREANRKLTEIRSALDALPLGAEHFRDEDPATLAGLLQDRDRLESELATAEVERGKLTAELEDLAGLEDVDRHGLLAELDSRLDALREADRRCRDLREQLDAVDDAPWPGPGDSPREAATITAETLDAIDAAWNDYDAARKALAARQDQAGGVHGAGHRSWWRLPAVLLPALAGGVALALTGRVLTGVILAVVGSVLALVAFGNRPAGQDRDMLLSDLKRRRDEARSRLEALLADLSLDLDPTNLSGLVLLRRCQRALEAADQRRNLEQALAKAQDERSRLLAAWRDKLAPMGMASAPDVPAAVGQHAALSRKLERRDELTRKLVTVTDAIEKTVQAQERTAKAIAALLIRLGLEGSPDVAEVEALREPRDRRQALVRDMAAQEGVLEEAQARLANLEDLFPADDPRRWDDLRLDEAITAEQDLQERLARISEDVSALELKIEQAGRGHELEDALASSRQAEDDLAEAWRLQLEAELGNLVLDTVVAEYEKKTRPVALQNAEELLRTITGRTDYTLHCRSGDDDTPEFVVHDRELGKNLTLDRLSTGTRTQLLLAVRLGFVMAGGPVDHPPLVLDDVLTTSDPGRFAGAVAGLGRLARDHGLQIISLCARPSEVAAWQTVLEQENLPQAMVIDLATARDLAAAAPPDILRAWAPGSDDRTPPSPAGMDSDAYGAALGVPAPALHDPSTALHMFFLLYDDLELLHELLLDGISTVGRWLESAERLRASGLLAPEVIARVDGRVKLWLRLADLLRRGRPPRVTPQDILDSPMNTKKLDEILEVLDKSEGKAEALIEALRARAVKNLKSTQIDLLEGYLRENGFLTDVPPLDRDAIILDLLTVSRNWDPALRPKKEAVHRLVDRLMRTLS